MTPTEEQELNEKVARLRGIPLRVTLWRFCYGPTFPITCGGWATKEDAEWEMLKLRRQGFGIKSASESYETDNPDIPNYASDLNAIREEILKLDIGDKMEWIGFLYQVARGNHDDKDLALVLSTPEQWCRAFIAVKEGRTE